MNKSTDAGAGEDGWVEASITIDGVPLEDLTTTKNAGHVELTPQHRLRFARQVLFFVFVLVVIVMFGYGLSPWHREAWEAMFELVKVGALPLVTLIIGFYFPSSNSSN